MKHTCRLLLFVITLCSSLRLGIAESDRPSGLDAAGFLKGVRVQDDLYRAVNGKWLDETEIPADKSNYGSFTALADLSQERIRTIIEQAAAADHPEGSDEQKVGDFYKSFMDESRVEQLDAKPLQAELDKIGALKTHEDVVRYLGEANFLGVQSPIGFYVGQDDKNSTRYLPAIVQSGTTLPDRDYYLKDDEKFAAAREALKSYIAIIFGLLDRATESTPEALLKLETQLAEVQWERTELRDANKRYNLFKLDDWSKKSPGIDWSSYFEAAGVGQITELNVMTPSYFEALDSIFRETPVSVWQDYLAFKLLDATAPILSQEFVNAHFDLHGKALAGIPEQQPRWKRGVNAAAGEGAGDFGVLGDVVGRLYVQEYFQPAAKARMDELVSNLLKAYEISINDLTWMTDATKEQAQEKLAKITTKIGYPDKWRDYDALTIRPDDLFGNMVRSLRVEYRRMIDKLGKPVDRDEWGMTPQTVNAYYNPGMNEIVFPAAILQPPFFNSEADDAVNYGGIGAVIGHEISHGFDDQGSKYDGDGNLKNWWSDEDREAFKALTERLVSQYEEYSPLPGRNVNGRLTLGENIADLSGLSIAYKAYQLSLNGATAEEIAGWSGDQRFFLGWSQVWRRKYRDAEMMQRLLTDPHSPSWYRANGPVINIDAFYDAFAVEQGDALFKPPSERIRIW